MPFIFKLLGEPIGAWRVERVRTQVFKFLLQALTLNDVLSSSDPHGDLDISYWRLNSGAVQLFLITAGTNVDAAASEVLPNQIRSRQVGEIQLLQSINTVPTHFGASFPIRSRIWCFSDSLSWSA